MLFSFISNPNKYYYTKRYNSKSIKIYGILELKHYGMALNTNRFNKNSNNKHTAAANAKGKKCSALLVKLCSLIIVFSILSISLYVYTKIMF